MGKIILSLTLSPRPVGMWARASGQSGSYLRAHGPPTLAYCFSMRWMRWRPAEAMIPIRLPSGEREGGRMWLAPRLGDDTHQASERREGGGGEGGREGGVGRMEGAGRKKDSPPPLNCSLTSSGSSVSSEEGGPHHRGQGMGAGYEGRVWGDDPPWRWHQQPLRQQAAAQQRGGAWQGRVWRTTAGRDCSLALNAPCMTPPVHTS